jgi:hypothetical protein
MDWMDGEEWDFVEQTKKRNVVRLLFLRYRLIESEAGRRLLK